MKQVYRTNGHVRPNPNNTKNNYSEYKYENTLGLQRKSDMMMPYESSKGEWMYDTCLPYANRELWTNPDGSKFATIVRATKMVEWTERESKSSERYSKTGGGRTKFISPTGGIF